MKAIKVFIFIFLSSMAFGQDLNNSFQSANELYISEQFGEAIDKYEELLNEGYINSEIYYNLGNCYYRTDQIGYAILYYEKAAKLTPEDPDIIQNLKISQSFTQDEFDIIPTPVYKQIWSSILKLFSSSTWTIIGFVFLFTCAFFLVFFLVKRKRKKLNFSIYMATMLLAISFLLLGYNRYKFDLNNRNGVLVTANAYIKSEPFEGEDLFIINEGTKAKIESTYKGWYKIRLSDGNSGWVDSEFFIEI